MPDRVKDRSERAVTLEVAPTAPGEPRPLIVPLKADGSHSPVFVVPGQYGEAFQFKRLAQRLRDDIPFYSFEARGLWGDVEPHATIPEAARDYIAEMRAVQPAGPYFLGGFSSGGQVAWEMAHQLQDAGETVHLLLFDIGPETLGRRKMLKAQQTPWRMVTYPLRVLTFHVRNASGLAGPRRRAYVRTTFRQEVRRFCRRVGLGREHFLFRMTLSAGRKPPPGHLAVRAAGRKQRDTWEWVPYTRPVTLLRATIQEPGIKRSKSLGLLPNLALGGLEVRDVSGHHGFIFSEPHVFKVIAELERWVDGIAARRTDLDDPADDETEARTAAHAS